MKMYKCCTCHSQGIKNMLKPNIFPKTRRLNSTFWNKCRGLLSSPFSSPYSACTLSWATTKGLSKTRPRPSSGSCFRAWTSSSSLLFRDVNCFHESRAEESFNTKITDIYPSPKRLDLKHLYRGSQKWFFSRHWPPRSSATSFAASFPAAGRGTPKARGRQKRWTMSKVRMASLKMRRKMLWLVPLVHH